MSSKSWTNFHCSIQLIEFWLNSWPTMKLRPSSALIPLVLVVMVSVARALNKTESTPGGGHISPPPRLLPPRSSKNQRTAPVVVGATLTNGRHVTFPRNGASTSPLTSQITESNRSAPSGNGSRTRPERKISTSSLSNLVSPTSSDYSAPHSALAGERNEMAHGGSSSARGWEKKAPLKPSRKRLVTGEVKNIPIFLLYFDLQMMFTHRPDSM